MSKAIREVRETVSLSIFVVVVVAGWNAETNEIASMKESFCAKQLSLCDTTLALIKWAELNSGLPCQYDTRLLSVPKLLHQTNRTDHEKLQSVNNAALPVDFQRTFYDDVMCEKYILGKLGPRALVHYKCLVIPAHRADFFRYVLLFFEGGIYLDIKSCFLLPISRILHACKACSLVTCIGAGDSHIHQGILICPVGHPLLHRAIHKVIETPPSFLSGRSPSYMTFCAQMWDLLGEQAVAKLKSGPNRLRDWGTAWLLREKKTSRKTITVHGMSILIDGYLAYMVDCSKPVVAIRCEGWKHGFKGGLDMRRIDVVAEMNTSALVNHDRINIIELDNDAVQVAKEGDIADVMQRFPNCYNSLTAVEISDFIVQGLIATPGFWLGCQFHCTKGRPKQFANGFCLNSIVSVVLCCLSLLCNFRPSISNSSPKRITGICSSGS